MTIDYTAYFTDGSSGIVTVEKPAGAVYFLLVFSLVFSLFLNECGANPIAIDDPKLIKLSDGRIVPFGQGVLCSDECPEIAPASIERNRLWLAVIPAGAIVAAIALRSPRVPLSPNQPRLPGGPLFPREPPGNVGLPESASLALVGIGFAILSGMLKRKRNEND